MHLTDAPGSGSLAAAVGHGWRNGGCALTALVEETGKATVASARYDDGNFTCVRYDFQLVTAGQKATSAARQTVTST